MNAPAPHSTFATGRGKLFGHLAMVGFAAFVAGSFSLGAIAAPYLAPAALNAARFVIGTGIMAGVALALAGGRIERPRAVWRYGVLGALMAVFFITMFVALRLTDPVSTGAVFTLMPLASAGFGWLFLGQMPRGIVVASLVLAAFGSLWVIFRGDLSAAANFQVGKGELIFFVGVLCHAAYGPLLRRFNRGETGVVFTLWTVTATGLCIAAWGWRDIVATDWVGLPPEAWLLYIANLLWTVAYDTYYAMADREDDLKIGVKSTAILFGDADRLIIASLQGMALFCLLLAGARFELGLAFHLGLAVAAACFAWEYHKTRNRKPMACFNAFLHNHWAGLAIFAGIVLDYALRS